MATPATGLVAVLVLFVLLLAGVRIGVAMGLVGLAALFVLLLFTLPPVLRYLDHREHRNRMVNRRPWSDDAAQRPKSRRRKDA